MNRIDSHCRKAGKRRGAVALLALCALLALPVATQAACPERVGVKFGDTLASIARACGVNVEALLQLNPGLTAQTLRQGSFVSVPRPPLPSARAGSRRGTVEIIPPLVRSPATGGTPTVILPPEPDYRPVRPLRPDETFTAPSLRDDGFGVKPFMLQEY